MAWIDSILSSEKIPTVWYFSIWCCKWAKRRCILYVTLQLDFSLYCSANSRVSFIRSCCCCVANFLFDRSKGIRYKEGLATSIILDTMFGTRGKGGASYVGQNSGPYLKTPWAPVHARCVHVHVPWLHLVHVHVHFVPEYKAWRLRRSPTPIPSFKKLGHSGQLIF